MRGIFLEPPGARPSRRCQKEGGGRAHRPGDRARGLRGRGLEIRLRRAECPCGGAVLERIRWSLHALASHDVARRKEEDARTAPGTERAASVDADSISVPTGEVHSGESRLRKAAVRSDEAQSSTVAEMPGGPSASRGQRRSASRMTPAAGLCRRELRSWAEAGPKRRDPPTDRVRWASTLSKAATERTEGKRCSLGSRYNER